MNALLDRSLIAFVGVVFGMVPAVSHAELMKLTSADGRKMEVFVLAVWSDEIMVVRRDKKEFSLTYEQLSEESLAQLSEASTPTEEGAKQLVVNIEFRSSRETTVKTGDRKTVEREEIRTGLNGEPYVKTIREREDVERKVALPSLSRLSILNSSDSLAPSGVVQWVFYDKDGNQVNQGQTPMPALGAGAERQISVFGGTTAVRGVVRQFRPDSSTTIWEEEMGSFPVEITPNWTGIQDVDLKKTVLTTNQNVRRAAIRHQSFPTPSDSRR